jgi:hypothetical protein
MHMAIAIVVGGESKEDALRTAKTTVEDYIVTENGFFDYDRDLTMDGKEINGVVELTDVKTMTAISNLIEYQERDFKDACDKLRKMFKENTNDQIYNDSTKIASEFWYNAHVVSDRVGGSYRVFDCDAEPFLTLSEIEKFQESNRQMGRTAYVYFRDVHF